MSPIFIQLICFKYRRLASIIIGDLQFHTRQIQRISDRILCFRRSCKYRNFCSCFRSYRNRKHYFISKIIKRNRCIRSFQRLCFVVGIAPINIRIVRSCRKKADTRRIKFLSFRISRLRFCRNHNGLNIIC